MDISHVMKIVDTEAAATIALGKGGWEGWLQCELWKRLLLAGVPDVERELAYPAAQGRERCDLVDGSTQPAQWIEIKAWGHFRAGEGDKFLDAIAHDREKLGRRPPGTTGLMVVAIPNATSDDFEKAIAKRRWDGAQRHVGEFVTVYAATV